MYSLNEVALFAVSCSLFIYLWFRHYKKINKEEKDVEYIVGGDSISFIIETRRLLMMMMMILSDDLNRDAGWLYVEKSS